MNLDKPRYYWAIGVAFILSSLLLYFPTWQAGFVMDYTGWIRAYDQGSFRDVWTSFGYKGLHQMLHLVFYSMYRLFGSSPWPWYLVFSSLHGLNAFLVFLVGKNIFPQNSSNTWLGLAAALLFLVSPFQAEVVVWRVCIHYLLTTAIILSSVYILIQYLKEPSTKKLLLIHTGFFFSLFLLELSFVTPIILLLVIVFWATLNRNTFKEVMNAILKVVAPQFALLACYFLLSTVMIGSPVGHYGAEKHLNFPIDIMVGHALSYFVKHLFIVRFFDFSVKDAIFSILSISEVTYAFLALTLLFLSVFTYKVWRHKFLPEVAQIVLLLIMFVVALLPVLNLFFVYLLLGENDRYGYLASAFLFLSLALVLSLMPKLLRIPLFVAFFVVNIYFLFTINLDWNNSTEVYNNLLNNYRWLDKEEVIVLGDADNYRGLYMFRYIGDKRSGIYDALQTVARKTPKGKVLEVMQFNMMTPEDSLNVRLDEQGNIDVSFAQWGNWFWKDGIGMKSYENEIFKVNVYQYSYVLEFKKDNPNRVVIYQAGDEWRELKL